jgi:hypothetical protein
MLCLYCFKIVFKNKVDLIKNSYLIFFLNININFLTFCLYNVLENCTDQ